VFLNVGTLDAAGGAFAAFCTPANFSTLATTPADVASTELEMEFAKVSTLAVVAFVGLPAAGGAPV
jgi:hypothetical protein